MSESDKPDINPWRAEALDLTLHEIEVRHWPLIAELQRGVEPQEGIFRLAKAMSPQRLTPPFPKQPLQLRMTLYLYAMQMFDAEAVEYPNDVQLEHWLQKLAERVCERVMRGVRAVERDASPWKSLAHHGVSESEMQESVSDDLKEPIRKWLEKKRAIPADTSHPTPDVAASRNPPSQASEESTPELRGSEGIVERREKLLDDYKKTTGQPSSQRIYEAPNCPIHKPEFYHWKNGSLSDNSRTTKQFEEFLRAKRRPQPKNPTT